MLRVAIALLLCSCAAEGEQPVIDEVTPSRIDPGVATNITINGRHFYGLASVDLGSGQSVQEDDAFAVSIGEVTIPQNDVSRSSSEQLSVQLPAMSDGLYDVVVTLPDLKRATLIDGLRVGAQALGADAGVGQDASPTTADANSGADAAAMLVNLETITVPTNGASVDSTVTLDLGVSYVLRASGTFDITGAGTIADAEYADFSALPGSLLDSISGVDFGIAIDDAVVDMTRTPKWGAFDISHIYQINFIGSGSTIRINFHDANPGNNTGTLMLEIMQLQ